MKNGVLNCCLAALITVGLCSTTRSEEAQVQIDLGGPRKVLAVISTTKEEYEIRVSLDPVRSFDDAMNRRLSQEKARTYGIEALIRYLSEKSKNIHSVKIRHVRITEVGRSADRFELFMSIPKEGVKLGEPSKHSDNELTRRGMTIPNLLTARNDFNDTLQLVANTLENEISGIEKSTFSNEESYEKIADLEEACVKQMSSLREAIKNDRWLLSLESEQLVQATTVEEERLLKKLRLIVKKFEKPKNE